MMEIRKLFENTMREEIFMKTIYLGISTLSKSWTLSENKLCMRRFFPKPISLMLSEDNILQLNKYFDEVYITFGHSSACNFFVKKQHCKKLFITTDFWEGRPGRRQIKAVIGEHAHSSMPGWVFFFCGPLSRKDETITKISGESVVVFYRDYDAFTIYIM